MDLARWEIVKQDVEGFPLIVPTTYRDATQEKIEELTGGCGPGKFGDLWVPDTNYGESIFLACQIHDWMYAEAEIEEDRYWADVLLWVNATTLVWMSEGELEGELLDGARTRRNTTYFLAVRRFGDELAKKKPEA